MGQNWTRLTREQSREVLNRLSTHRDAIVFSKDTTEVSVRRLPFYTSFYLCRLVNYATMPTFSMFYITNGVEFYALDGTPNPIYTVNEKDPIRLNDKNALEYLDFFFSNVQGSEGDVFLIKDPSTMPLLSSLPDVQQAGILTSFKPIYVTQESTSLKVSGTMYYGGGLIAATILISQDGKIGFQDQSLLMSGIYFPHNPYAEAWLEGAA